MAYETKEREAKLIKCLCCGGKTRTKIDKDTILIHFPLYCPKCKVEMKINVKQMKVSVVNE